MALSERELEQIISNQLSKELASNINVPDVEDQWQKIKQRILEENETLIIRKKVLTPKRLTFAATILISIGTITFLYPHDANAVGGKITEFFNYIVGKTTRIRTETYQQVNWAERPKVQELGDNVEMEVTLEMAQSSIPFMLATPSYLPPETNIRRILLTSLGADIFEITVEYNLNKNVIVFSQQNSANGTSRGSLYDTDDTVVKDLTINSKPAILFVSKQGINTLNWQSRGLLLQLSGILTEEEIIKIANSIK